MQFLHALHIYSHRLGRLSNRHTGLGWCLSKRVFSASRILLSCWKYLLLFTYSYSPVNTKKLFNLHHAQACNMIEHIFWGSQTMLPYSPSSSSLFPWLPTLHPCCSVCSSELYSRNWPGWRQNTYQAAYEPFPSDVSSDHDGSFIGNDDDDEGNSEVKLRRMNIANEMWESYLHYTADDSDSFSSAE